MDITFQYLNSLIWGITEDCSNGITQHFEAENEEYYFFLYPQKIKTGFLNYEILVLLDITEKETGASIVKHSDTLKKLWNNLSKDISQRKKKMYEMVENL